MGENRALGNGLDINNRSALHGSVKLNEGMKIPDGISSMKHTEIGLRDDDAREPVHHYERNYAPLQSGWVQEEDSAGLDHTNEGDLSTIHGAHSTSSNKGFEANHLGALIQRLNSTQAVAPAGG